MSKFSEEEYKLLETVPGPLWIMTLLSKTNGELAENWVVSGEPLLWCHDFGWEPEILPVIAKMVWHG